LEQLDPGSTTRATVIVGAALGVLVSISSVGAGAVGVTALLLLYPRLPMTRIVGSDIAHAVPLTLVAGIGHWATGAIDWHLLGVLLIGSLPGIVFGSYCAHRGGLSDGHCDTAAWCRPDPPFRSWRSARVAYCW
jgi:uncharacterized membrane protein YfcA